jgi:hypothetical protein
LGEKARQCGRNELQNKSVFYWLPQHQRRKGPAICAAMNGTRARSDAAKAETAKYSNARS